MSKVKHYDQSTLYVTSGVAREHQLLNSLKCSLADVRKELGEELECQFKVNLIVDKDGNYYGFGYIRVSNPEVYWMLLGKNPDGTERCLEYLDPNWIPPLPLSESEREIDYINTNLSWAELVAEEEKYIHPYIREELEPLMKLAGYTYNREQKEHLYQIALKEGKNIEVIPEMGYFEISRAYCHNVDINKSSNKLCARYVPDWIPEIVFKNIFRHYASDPNKQVNVHDEDNIITDTYPLISSMQGKKQGRLVFVTYDPEEQDGLFALLMTRKVKIQHPKNKELKCTLVFDHAYDNKNKSYNNNNNNNNNKDDYIERRKKKLKKSDTVTNAKLTNAKVGKKAHSKYSRDDL